MAKLTAPGRENYFVICKDFVVLDTEKDHIAIKELRIPRDEEWNPRMSNVLVCYDKNVKVFRTIGELMIAFGKKTGDLVAIDWMGMLLKIQRDTPKVPRLCHPNVARIVDWIVQEVIRLLNQFNANMAMMCNPHWIEEWLHNEKESKND